MFYDCISCGRKFRGGPDRGCKANRHLKGIDFIRATMPLCEACEHLRWKKWKVNPPNREIGAWGLIDINALHEEYKIKEEIIANRREKISLKTREGLSKKGFSPGRPRIVKPEIERVVLELRERGLSYPQIAKECGLGYGTVYSIVNPYNNNWLFARRGKLF